MATREELAAMPREEAVETVRRDLGVSELQARLALAVVLGESEGDVKVSDRG